MVIHKALASLIVLAVVGLIVVAFRLRSRFRGYSSRRDTDRHESEAFAAI